MSKTTAGPVNQGRLKSFVERIEKLREEKKAIGSDEREVFSEAKGVGYDTGTIRWLLKEREVDQADRDERDTLRDTYAHALGMAVDLVRVEGLSQREAAKRTGTSKSSVNRALAVPEVSQPAPAGQSKGIGHNSKRACILPRPAAWKEITLSRDAADASVLAEQQRIAAEKEAERERRAAEREAERRRNAEIDADTLDFPEGLRRLGTTFSAGFRDPNSTF